MVTNGDPVSGDLGDFAAELERQRIDARGPEFEGLVDRVLINLRCPRDRDDVRVGLDRLLQDYLHDQWVDGMFSGVDPCAWLDGVLTTVKQLEMLLEQAKDPNPSASAEVADLRFDDSRLTIELQLLKRAGQQRLAEIVDYTKANKREGRSRDRSRRGLLANLAGC
jgi:hypothetical protein